MSVCKTFTVYCYNTIYLNKFQFTLIYKKVQYYDFHMSVKFGGVSILSAYRSHNHLHDVQVDIEVMCEDLQTSPCLLCIHCVSDML